ncbi:MAG: aminotransferase class I/II-fold pyridoxal phosphate-dependent enzyme [Caldimonas sp.]
MTRGATVREALKRLEDAGTGVLLLVDAAGLFERTVTDGDIRRLLLDGTDLDGTIETLPTIDSVVLRVGYTRQGALELMNEHAINHLPVLDSAGHVVRLIDRKEVDEQILLSTPHLGTREREFVEEAFRTNWIAPLGPNVDAFERELAEMVGVGHAAALSSGTAAIHLALLLLGVTRGDVVFCSALTFAASANPIVYQGAEPVFIDSEPDSWNMSAAALEAAFADAHRNRKMPKAVIVVNLYGQSADIDPLAALCRRYEVPIVEDAAESLGARYKGKPSGSFGRIGIFSFNGNKIITTSGGGMLVSDDAALVARARFLATQAREPAIHYEHAVIGYNYRMSNILAGVGRGQLTVLSDRVASRRRIFERYRAELGSCDGIEFMPEPDWSHSNRWLSTATLSPGRRGVAAGELIRRLAAQRIEARPVWKPLQLQPVFATCRYFRHPSHSVSQELFENGICLPSGSNLTDEQQDRVIEEVGAILGAAG